ncbi:hypothetical protein ACIBL8_41100 [Streptomyces sp. NPDC050523]|uniref:hypothetical protein n=1 Tax=Streptomyces sp. NPDC050523 TaxID=3365622 RepID=UPI00378927B7
MKPQQSSRPSTTLNSLVTDPDESELAPFLTAWDTAHPALSDPEWRHVLDEIAHPRTTQAFRRLAETA